MKATSSELHQQELSPGERRALGIAMIWEAVALAGILCLILIPGAPLHGTVPGGSAPKWTQAVVPMIFLLFLAPGLGFGIATGVIRNQTDIAKCFIHAMAQMASIVALAFFAAQFIEYLKYSQLDRMIAFVGGKTLVDLGLPPSLLLVGIVGLSLFVNLFIGSMSAKWTMLAPILVPMLMMVGISPELTQVSYRVGDSATNIVTPLNSYALIILLAMQRYSKNAGMGSMIAMMVPYSVAFAIVWSAFLVLWYVTGYPLGPSGPLNYSWAQ